jgi:hypothetical protein
VILIAMIAIIAVIVGFDDRHVFYFTSVIVALPVAFRSSCAEAQMPLRHQWL